MAIASDIPQTLADTGAAVPLTGPQVWTGADMLAAPDRWIMAWTPSMLAEIDEAFRALPSPLPGPVESLRRRFPARPDRALVLR